LAQAVQRPKRIRPGRFKSRLVEAVPRVALLLRADADVVRQLRSAGRWSRLEHVDPVSSTGRVRVELESRCVRECRAFGSRVELLEPSHLRRRIAIQATATAALYAD
jgi:predicted DNA-binding transcriptional regulator YafY